MSSLLTSDIGSLTVVERRRVGRKRAVWEVERDSIAGEGMRNSTQPQGSDYDSARQQIPLSLCLISVPWMVI